ncbi:MAG: ADOP family duplicated permease [Candidatus Acidiferrales bacterium]
MGFLRRFLTRLANFATRRRDDERLKEEIEGHIALQTAENLRAGLSPAEARRQAMLKFGAVEAIKEDYHAERGLLFLETLLQDVRFALRMLRKSPGFTLVAIFTLALGIASTVAIFGFVDSALIRPLPYDNSSRLVAVGETDLRGSGKLGGYSYLNFLDVARANQVFASSAAYHGLATFALTDATGVHLVPAAVVTPNFFRTLGVTPTLGKDFDPVPLSEDLQTDPATVILSYAAWQNWFGGRPGILGKTVAFGVKRELYSVIGVLPRSFEFAPAGTTDFWTTLRPYAPSRCYKSRGCEALDVIARLKDGVTLPQALADVQAIAARESRLHPDPDKYRGATILPLTQYIFDDTEPILLALLGAVALLLLIAYVNVAALLLVRSQNRRHEFSVRRILGAGRARLTQQFVIEGLVVVTLSSALGLAAAILARRLLLKLIPADMLDSMPYLRTGWHWHVGAFAAALVLIALIIFAVTPALQLPLAGLRAGLASGATASTGTSWRSFGAKLVVLELATTMVLLVGAGLLGKSLYKLLHVDIGFTPSHLATLWMAARAPKYVQSDQDLALQREVVSRLQNLPGVRAVGIVNDLPLGGDGGTQIGFVGRPALGFNNEVGHVQIGVGYLPTLKARLLEGRYFNENDNLNAPLVAIINQTLARRYFANQNPIGKQIFYHAHDIALEASQAPIQIVGVIADIKQNSLDESGRADVYTPFAQSPDSGFSIAVRTSQDAASILPLIISTLHKIDSSIVVTDASTMQQIIQHSWAAYMHRASAWLAGGFAALALLLSAVGLYGVIAYSVGRRTREIGVRMALGAQRKDVLRLVLGEGARLALIGLSIGIVASLFAARWMSSLLFGIEPADPLTFVTVAILLALVALAACWIPARRAMRVDPMVALRYE